MPENNKEITAGKTQEAELLEANMQSNPAQENNNAAASEEEAENIKKEMAKIEARLLELEMKLKTSQDNGNNDEIDKTKEEIASVAQEKMKCYSKICSYDKDIANVDGALIFYNHDKFTDYVDELKSFHEKLGLRYEIQEKIDEKTSALTTVFVTFTPEKFDHKDLTELTAEDLREIHNSYKEDDRESEKDNAKSDTNTKLAKENEVDNENHTELDSKDDNYKKDENQNLADALMEVQEALTRNRENNKEKNQDDKENDKDKKKDKEEEKREELPDDDTFEKVEEKSKREKLEEDKNKLEKQKNEAVGEWTQSVLNQREGGRNLNSANLNSAQGANNTSKNHERNPQHASQQNGNFSWLEMVRQRAQREREQEYHRHTGGGRE